MRIGSSLPMHIARAYGAAAQRPTVPAAEAAPVAPSTRAPIVDAREPSANVARLVGARVSVPVEFSAPTGAANQAYQLYTRAADRIEAAVAVQIGRSIDVEG